MAYVVLADAFSYPANTASPTADILEGHAVDDLLLAFVWQDQGGIAISAVTSGWVEVGTQAAHNSQRLAVFWKRATSDNEPDFEASGGVYQSTVVLLVIRGVNWANPFNLAVNAGWAGASTTTPAGTTTVNNCLLIYACGTDGVARSMPRNPNDMICAAKSSLGIDTGPLIVGYRNQPTAGAVPEIDMMCTETFEGGTFWTIAIEDDGAGMIGPDSRQTYEVLKHLGRFSANHDSITWEAISAISGSPTIDGYPLDTAVPTWTNPAGNNSNCWNKPFALQTGSNLAAASWSGGSFALASPVDMSGKLFGVRVGLANWAFPFLSRFAVVFQDSVGSWVAFDMPYRPNPVGFDTVYTVIDLENGSPIDSSGVMDWSDVTRVGFAYLRNTGTTSIRQMMLSDAHLFAGTVMHGGSQAAPCSSAFLASAACGWSDSAAALLQGTGQTLARIPFTMGDGANRTYVNEAAKSLEGAQAYGQTLLRRLWNGTVDSIGYRIKASATDIMRLSGGVAATDLEQPFIIDAASSPSASYDFSGLVLSGWRVDHAASGVTMNGVTFLACRQITLAGDLLNCLVLRSLALSAVVTADPSNVTGCEFTSGGTGHAIEITSPGAYTFTGNTFTGYGADGTTDAAIYNNSGGAVTLNITGGGDTPTVRNGAGASTTINNNVSITLQEVVVGSSIRVELVSDGSLVEFRVADATTEVFSVGGSVTYRIKVRKASETPYYRPWSTTTTPANDVSITVTQELDE